MLGTVSNGMPLSVHSYLADGLNYFFSVEDSAGSGSGSGASGSECSVFGRFTVDRRVLCRDTNSSALCNNRGSCVLGDTGMLSKCNCPDIYGGEFCGEILECVVENPCLNGATCVDGNCTMSCSCMAGHTGEGKECQFTFSGNAASYIVLSAGV